MNARRRFTFPYMVALQILYESTVQRMTCGNSMRALAQEGKTLDGVLLLPTWSCLAPLRHLLPLWRELREPEHRLRKVGI